MSFFRIIGLLAAISVAACTNSQGVNTLDELTISASNDGELQKPINLHYPLQSRFLSVNGQLPVPGPSSSCLASSFRVANSIICFSPDRGSHVLVKEYEYEGGVSGLIEVQKKLTNLQLSVAKLVSEDTDSRTEVLDEERVANAKSIAEEASRIAFEAQRENLFIFRWAASSSGDIGGRLGEIFSAGASGQKEATGLVIVGGLKVSQLLVGLNDFGAHVDGMPEGTKVATLTMAADHILYFANGSLSAAVEAALTGTGEQIRGLSAETRIALQAYAQLGTAQENQGLFSAPEISTVPLSEVNLDENNGQVFYATMTDVADLKAAISGE